MAKTHGAYRMTSARRIALRKAQRAAAIKRHQRAKRNKRIAIGAGIGVGVLAGVGAGYVVGTRTKTGAPASANPANKKAGFLSTAHKEAVRVAGAISPPRAYSKWRLRKTFTPVVPGKGKPPVPRPPKPSEDVIKAQREAANTKDRAGKDPITGLPTRPMNPAYKAPRIRGGKMSESAAKKAVAKDQSAKIAMGVEHKDLIGTQKRVDTMKAEGQVRRPRRKRTGGGTRRTRQPGTGTISAEQRLRNAAFDQYLKDFGG